MDVWTSGWKVPAGQVVQAMGPTEAMKVPAAHIEHADTAEAPVVGVCVPLGQLVQPVRSLKTRLSW